MYCSLDAILTVKNTDYFPRMYWLYITLGPGP